MLSTAPEIKEDYDILARDGRLAEKSYIVEPGRQLQNCFMQGSENQAPSDQLHEYFDKPLRSSKMEISATPPEIGSDPTSSSMPVLHRFTLDDQVQAERMVNSQREAGFS